MITPSTAANAAASSGAIGNGTPQLVVRKLSVNAPAPARLSCATETCPA